MLAFKSLTVSCAMRLSVNGPVGSKEPLPTTVRDCCHETLLGADPGPQKRET